MADWKDNKSTRTQFGADPQYQGDVEARTTFDAGLRKHMLSIYNYMASGVLLSGLVAMLLVNSPLFSLLYAAVQTPEGVAIQPTILGYIVMFAPLGIVLAMNFGMNKFSAGALQAMFWAYTVLFGASVSYILLIYTGGSIIATFFASAGAFAGVSLLGYTTKKDLSPMGAFLSMGVIGLIILMVLNMLFFKSTTLDLAISAIGILIFSGLTAYYTQSLKDGYAAVRGTEWERKTVILGALTLYIAFVNIFLFMLRFMGGRE